MPFVRAIVIGLVGLAFIFTVAASHAAQPTLVSQAVVSEQLQSVSTGENPKDPKNVVWARIASCNCFTVGTTATTNVANALKEANLTVDLKEVSPSDGWLYFVVSYEGDSTMRERVVAAIEAGGGEVLDGPP